MAASKAKRRDAPSSASKVKAIPLDNHVLRHAAFNRLQKDGNQVPVRLEPQAFHLRPQDGGHLSVTWVEYFSEDEGLKIEMAIKAFRQSMETPMKASKKGGFGKAKVSDVVQAWNTYAKRKVRILHAPSKKNGGHSQIRNFQDQNSDLLNILASSVFSTLILNNSIAD